MICEYCKGIDHDGQPKSCQGGTHCDCAHRPVNPIYKTQGEIKNEQLPE